MKITIRLAGLVLAWLFLLHPREGRAAAFLFDATKAETVANADWVIDEDNHVAARYPTPAAAEITQSSTESYWTGGLSAWGVALVQLGNQVESLPVGARITYLDSTNPQDLSNYQVYVVCEPNILFTSAEKTAIARYVQDGGSLFVISDHTGSDRNNDGYDSVAVWNDFFSSNGIQTNPFGVTINSTNISLVSSEEDTTADNPLTNGPLGAVSLLKYSNGATMTIDPVANPTTRAAFWSGSSHTNSNVMVAYGSFGAGRFAILGDSSPVDDGTGSSGHTLYYGWTEEGTNHSNLALNASLWLSAAGDSTTPYNDAFARAIRLDPSARIAAGTSTGASRETGEPSHAGNSGGASVWWQFTAAYNGNATISTQGSDFDTLLAVYTGDAVNALTRVASNDNVSSSQTESAVQFSVTAGTTYRIAVDGAGGASGHIALSLALPAPANDLFSNATPLAYTGTTATYTGRNLNATLEPGEPSHAGYTGGRSVWWSWTAATGGAVTISTIGSDFDTLLAVYTGSSINALTSVASNANYGSSLQSQVGFNAVAGVTYRIAVDGYAGAAGNIALALSPGSSTPINDNFLNAIPLSGTSLSTSAITSNATKETYEPAHAGNAGGHSVWWRWIAPGDGIVTITTVGSNFDTTLGVYQGAAVNALTTLAGDDDGGGSQKSKLSMIVTADTAYSIAVDGFGSAAGSAVLNISYSAGNNDYYSAAYTLSGTTATASGTNFNASLESEELSFWGGSHSVWWKWTAPGNLIVTVSTFNSTFDTFLTILTGSTPSSSNYYTWNDDYSGKTSQVSFAAEAGVTYSIRVDGVNGAAGKIALGLKTAALPVVSLTATTLDASEKDLGRAVFTVTLNAPTEINVYARLDLNGTATAGSDYSTLPATQSSGPYATIFRNQSGNSATFTIVPIADLDPTEGDETVTATLVPNRSYQINPAAASARIVIHDNSPYSSAWQSLYRPSGFLGAAAAPTADFDGDGLSNFEEFAFNLNPLLTGGSGALSIPGSAYFTDATAGETRRYATLTFLRRSDAPNLTYTVEASDNLAIGSWTSSNVIFVSSSAEGVPTNTEKVVYRSSLPLDGPNASPRQFLRVRVVFP